MVRSDVRCDSVHSRVVIRLRISIRKWAFGRQLCPDRWRDSDLSEPQLTPLQAWGAGAPLPGGRWGMQLALAVNSAFLTVPATASAWDILAGIATASKFFLVTKRPSLYIIYLFLNVFQK